MRRDPSISADDVKRVTCTERGIATYGYLTLAVDQLAEGNRRAATSLMQQSVDAGFYQYYAHKWSRAFLRRIDDPNWLRWFPPKTLQHDDEIQSSAQTVDESPEPVLVAR
ncbi:MAG: hypothetical protein AAF664_23660 [Planctomycetota bacterium]